MPVLSCYERSVSDPAIGGRETLICIRVRRFFGDNSDCSRKTFAEQVPGLTVPYARRTRPAAAASVGERRVGVGWSRRRALAVDVSRMTLLRLNRALPVPEPGTVSVWAGRLRVPEKTATTSASWSTCTPTGWWT
jgi:hypothetical protein